MTAPFLALITPLASGLHPDNTLPVPQPPVGPVDPGYSPPWAQVGGPRPSHPIMLPGMPGWGSGGPVDPGYSPPWAQVGGPRPSHPIYYPPYPDNSLPPFPSHPIYIPPEGSPPPLGIWGPPDMPPGFWGGGMGPGVKPQPHPEHPIVLPPDLPPTTGEGGKITWKTAWTPQTGWIVIGIPAEGTLVPTPSGIGQSPTKGKP